MRFCASKTALSRRRFRAQNAVQISVRNGAGLDAIRTLFSVPFWTSKRCAKSMSRALPRRPHSLAAGVAVKVWAKPCQKAAGASLAVPRRIGLFQTAVQGSISWPLTTRPW